jgi:amidase
VARDFFGQDNEVDWVMEASLAAMRSAGATVVDVRLPKWLMDSKGEFYSTVRLPEFPVQLAQYLATLKPGYPKTLDEIIERAYRLPAPRADGAGPNGSRWSLFAREKRSGSLTDPRYTAVHDHALPLVTAALDGLFAADKLDALVYPTSPRRPELISAPAPAATVPGGPGAGDGGIHLASLSGFPELVVPAGFTGDRLPVGISFVGPAFSEGRLLGLGYAFEQVTKARRLPAHTPPLKGEKLPLGPR